MLSSCARRLVSKWIHGSLQTAFYLARRSLTDAEYNRIADESLELLLTDLEEYFDQIQAAEVDISYAQGVLTLSMGSKGTYVINKQTPNKQIWLSSPVRYDYENGEWIYHRDLHNMKKKLTNELLSFYKKEPKLH